VRFTDGAGILYNPATAQIVLDTVAPATTASPAPSTFINGVNVALSASEPGSTIRYTLNGSDPANAANNPLAYTGPIGINATTTVRYYATDIAGNAETPKSGIYTITPSSINASVTINGGAPVTNNALVNLAISATGAVLDKMSFSNNGITYTTPENYAVSKSWTLSAGDGVKTVFVRFHNTGSSLTYDPVTAQIVFDTTAPATTPSPLPATFITQVNVSLAANEPGSVIRYTTDGSDPANAANNPVIYAGPITLTNTATVRYFATDVAGNAELPKSGMYTVHSEDLVVNTFTINGGAATTTSPNVTLSIDATDAMGVTRMRFSNDGVNYSSDENYAASKNWTLSNGDGVKTVFVRFTDGAGILYNPATAQIVLDTVAPATTASPAPATFINGVNVALSASEPGSTILYTLDGSDPKISGTAVVYTAPIRLTNTATVRYFTTDIAGNAETPKSGTYTITSPTLNASVTINGGAQVTNNSVVNLAIAAAGVDKISFSNNGVTYTTPEAYATSKTWTVDASDGVKTVFVRFHDTLNSLTYDPVTAQIVLDTVAPATSVIPAPAKFIISVNVALTASEPGSTIRYTLDGSDPKTSGTAIVYAGPINIASTAALKYFARDFAGNEESVKSGLYTIYPPEQAVYTLKINGGASTTGSSAVTLSMGVIDATDVIDMRFSNDGITYTAAEPFTISKPWNLSPGDGHKTVYVRFADKNNVTQAPVTAMILLDTVPPVTTASPEPGIHLAANVTLTTNEPGSTIKYTLDGSDPKTSGTAVVYGGPVNIASTATLKYFATDLAGNIEAVKSGLYTIHTADLADNTFKINGGTATTGSSTVTLSINATDSTGVSKMRFSNDGVTYAADEPYASGKSWDLSPG